MATEHHDRHDELDASKIRNVGGAHEHRDINVRGILGFLVTLTVAALIIHLLLFVMFDYLKGSYKDPEQSPVLAGREAAPESDPAKNFPAPKLQPDPVRDMNRMRIAEDALLHAPPSWADQQKGMVRIPIDEAIQLTVRRGLPVQPAGGGEQQQGAAQNKNAREARR